MEAPVFASPDYAVPEFGTAIRLAVESGLDAAAILDGTGKSLATAGALDPDEARALAALVTRRLKSPDMLDRMLRGQMLTLSLDDREASMGIVASCVFVVVVFPRARAAVSLVAVDQLRSDVAHVIADAKALSGSGGSGLLPPPTGSSGGSSGPAELPVIEIGVTVRRNQPN